MLTIQNNSYELQLNNPMLATCLGTKKQLDHYKQSYRVLSNECQTMIIRRAYNVMQHCNCKRSLEEAPKQPKFEYDIAKGCLEEIKPGYEVEKNEDGSLKRDNNGDVVKHRKPIRWDNIIRAREKVFELMFCNYSSKTKFLTFTYAKNMQDWNQAKEDIHNFLKNVLPRYCDKNKLAYSGAYLWVSELQARGAIHFHIVLFDVDYIPNKELRKLWKHGYVKINKVQGGPTGAAKYLAKYIGKDMAIVNSNGAYRDVFYNSYNCSKGLKKADIFYSTDFNTRLEGLLPTNVKPIDTKTHVCEYFITLKDPIGINQETGEVIYKQLDCGYTEWTYIFDCCIDVRSITERTGERFFEAKAEEIYEDKYDQLQAEHLDKECDDFNAWFRRNQYHLQAGYVFSAFLDEMAKKDMFYSLRNRLKNEVIYRDNVNGSDAPFYDIIRKKYDYSIN